MVLPPRQPIDTSEPIAPRRQPWARLVELTPAALVGIARRLREQRSVLAAVAAVMAVLVVAAGLPLVWGVLGFLALAATRKSATTEPFAIAVKNPDAPPLHIDHHLADLLQAFPDPAVLLDTDDRVLLANTAATTRLPMQPGDRITTLLRAPDLSAALSRCRATGQQQAFEVRSPSPVERFEVGHVTLIPELARALLVLHDQSEADKLGRMRADFVANASHELRTPLASLKGFIETLQGAAKDDPQAREQFLGIMLDEAARMSRLIDDLLSLSRIEMREHVAPKGAVDLTEVVAGVARSLAQVATEAGITIEVPTPPAAAFVFGDADELTQVVQNLVQNAIKYGRRGGRVSMSMKRDGDRVALVVADNGIGIAPEHLPRLTERFYRVSAKDSRVRGGTGLGLAVVKHIVNRHRGELKIDSRAGVGSTFTVVFNASTDNLNN